MNTVKTELQVKQENFKIAWLGANDVLCLVLLWVEHQSFWEGSIHFGQVQIKKLVQKNLIWTWPKLFGPDQSDLGTTKTIWTVQNHSGLIIIEGQGIRVKMGPSHFCQLYTPPFKKTSKFPINICSFRQKST